MWNHALNMYYIYVLYISIKPALFIIFMLIWWFNILANSNKLSESTFMCKVSQTVHQDLKKSTRTLPLCLCLGKTTKIHDREALFHARSRKRTFQQRISAFWYSWETRGCWTSWIFDNTATSWSRPWTCSPWMRKGLGWKHCLCTRGDLRRGTTDSDICNGEIYF